ncbi:hypothetical protein [Aquabacterium lacunae]|nr:hypothetical protein [Aquabacterium lacunae]
MYTPWFMKRFRHFLVAAGACVAIVISAGLVACWDCSGFIPLEILRHLERRLDGHPRLQMLGSPALGAMRWLNDQLDSDVPASPDSSVEPSAMREVPGSLNPFQESPAIWLLRGETRKRVGSLADAAAQAVDGDVVLLQPGVHWTNGAVWRGKSVSIRGDGGLARLMASSDLAEGKALLVLGGGSFEVRHLAFQGARVADRNGAGIRFEGGRLRVEHCVFQDSESGILINGDPDEATTEVQVSFTEFARLGDGMGYAHAVYAGRIRLLELRGNHFHHGKVGHLVKSRAQVSKLVANRITDNPGGQASYELNFPNGGQVFLIGNVIGQSRSTQNGAVLSMLEEGQPWARNELHAVHNSWVNLHPFGGRFLQVAGPLSGGQVWRNLVVGRGTWRVPEGVPSGGNLRVGLDAVQDAQAGDLRPGHWQPEWVADSPPLVDGAEVSALTEVYRHPLRVEPLPKGRALLVGALQ